MSNTVRFDKTSGKYICSFGGEKFTTKLASTVEYRYRKITGQRLTLDQIMGGAKVSSATSVATVVSVNDKFDINTRFEFVEGLVGMVASGVQASAIITGTGGLGKSYTVIKSLKAAGFTDVSELEIGVSIQRSKAFRMIKGFSTAKGLYRTLYENNGGVIVFDDCDDVLKDPVAVNVLKGALDSFDKRIICWNADMKDEDLPRSFIFTGKVIFISNMEMDKINQAIRSRSMVVDLAMTDSQKIERMAKIMQSDEFLPEYEMVVKQDALALIKDLKDRAKDINLRTLISVSKVRAAGGKNWKAMAEYFLCS